MDVLQLLRFLMSRLLLLVHGVVSVYLMYANTDESKYWCLLIPMSFLLFEISYTLVARKGMEFRYFWPSGFFYILTLLPIIWIIEMELLSERIEMSNKNKPVSQESTAAATSTIVTNSLGISNEVIGKKVCEVGIIIGLITGRWMMPRGSLTRDQLSALLLGYVGNAADILELFETFEDPDIIHERKVTIAVIAVYSWSVLQFTLVTTATIKDKKGLDLENVEKKQKPNQISPLQKLPGMDIHRNSTAKNEYINEIKTRSTRETKVNRGRGQKFTTSLSNRPDAINAESSVPCDKTVQRRALHGEVFQILVTLVMQDGPFLIVRLYLIVVFNVVTEMHIFFTCKNAIVSILLVYRLCVLTCRGKDREIVFYREDTSWRLNNVQRAVSSNHLKTKQTGKIRVR